MKMEGDKICQTELMFIDLMILVNFSPICQSKVKVWQILPFSLLHAFLEIEIDLVGQA